MSLYPKDPNATVDFSIDWRAWLTASEVITSATWHIDPEGGGAPVTGATIDGGSVQGVYVSGGLPGSRYLLTCRIETDAGRQADRSITIRVMEQ